MLVQSGELDGEEAVALAEFILQSFGAHDPMQ